MRSRAVGHFFRSALGLWISFQHIVGFAPRPAGKMPLRPSADEQSIEIAATHMIIHIECDGTVFKFFDKVSLNHLHEHQ